MSQASSPNKAALNGLMVALLGGNPAVQEQMNASGKSLDDLLGSMSGGQAPAGAQRGLGIEDLFGDTSGRAKPVVGKPSGGKPSGGKPSTGKPSQDAGGDILGSLLSGMLGGGAPSGEMPTQGAGGDALGSLLGGLLGGGQAPTQTPAQAAGEDAMGSLLGNMLGGGMQSQAPAQSGGGDLLGSLLGGMLGGGGMPAQGGTPKPSQQMPMGGGDPVGSLLGSLLGVNMGGGVGAAANNPIANAFVAPIASALAKKFGIPQAIAQVVVVFALSKLMASATGRASEAQFDPSDLVNRLATGGNVTQKYLKDSGLVDQLAQESGLDQKTASKSLQQTFAALSTQMGEGSMDERQAELRTLLKTWK